MADDKGNDNSNDKGNDSPNGGQDQPSLVEPTNTINSHSEITIVEDSHIAIHSKAPKPGTTAIGPTTPIREDVDRR